MEFAMVCFKLIAVTYLHKEERSVKVFDLKSKNTIDCLKLVFRVKHIYFYVITTFPTQYLLKEAKKEGLTWFWKLNTSLDDLSPPI